MPRSYRGIWAETASPEALRDAATWRLLARYGLHVAVAVRPGELDLLSEWADRAREHAVRLAVWPMIEDAAGRWLSAANAPAFARLVRETRDRVAQSHGAAELVLDLEPPFPMVRGALDGRVRAALDLWSLVRGTPEHAAGQRAIEALCHELTEGGAALTLGVVPFVLFDEAHSDGWASLCGGPRGLAATRVNVMLYTSLIQGYSNGALGRDDTRALLAHGCAAAARRYGERASVSLGAVGLGALGDEPVYAGPHELADDTAIAMAAGAHDLWLFDLGGVLSRGAVEPWLDAFTGARPSAVLPRSTARSRALAAALRGLGKLLSLAARPR